MTTSELRHRPDRSRYELLEDGEPVAWADYRIDGDHVVLHHTWTEPARRGGGRAARVVAFALDDVRTSGRTVVPACSFVAEFVAEHPEHRDIVAT